MTLLLLALFVLGGVAQQSTTTTGTSTTTSTSALTTTAMTSSLTTAISTSAPTSAPDECGKFPVDLTQCNTWSTRIRPTTTTTTTTSTNSSAMEFSIVFNVSTIANKSPSSLFVTIDPDDLSPVSRFDRFALSLYRLSFSDDVNMSSNVLVAHGNLSLALSPDQVLHGSVFGLVLTSNTPAIPSVRVSIALLDVVILDTIDTIVVPQCRLVDAPAFVHLLLPTPPPAMAHRIDARAQRPLMGSTCIKFNGWPMFQCFNELFSRHTPPLIALLHDRTDSVAADGAILRVCSAEQMLVRGSIRDCRALAVSAGAASVRSALAVRDVKPVSAAAAVWEVCPTLTLCGVTECRRGAVAAAATELWYNGNATAVPQLFGALCDKLTDADDRLACVQGVGAGVVGAIYDGECTPQLADNRTLVDICASAASVAVAPNDTAAALVARCLRGAFEAVHQNCAVEVADNAAFAQYTTTACKLANTTADRAPCVDALGAVVALRAEYNTVNVVALCGNVTECVNATNVVVADVVARPAPVRSGPCGAIRVAVNPIGVTLPMFDGLNTWIPLAPASDADVLIVDGAGVDMRFAMRATLVPLVTVVSSPSSSSSALITTTTTATKATTTTQGGSTAPLTLGPVPTYTLSRGCKAHCELFCGSTAAALCVCAGQRISCAAVPGMTDRAIHGGSGDVDSAVAPNAVNNAAWLVPLVVFGALALVGVGACAAALARHRRNTAFARRRL